VVSYGFFEFLHITLSFFEFHTAGKGIGKTVKIGVIIGVIRKMRNPENVEIPTLSGHYRGGYEILTASSSNGFISTNIAK
jgi:hypothetical protein